MIGVATALLLGGLETYLSVHHEERASSARLRFAAGNLAANLRIFLEWHAAAVRSVAAEATAEGRYDPEVLQLRLDRCRRQNHGFLTMIAADREGRVVAASPRLGLNGRAVLAQLQNVADREYFQRGLVSPDAYISNVFQGRGFGSHFLIAISAPVLDARGRPVGVVEGSLDVDRLALLVLPELLPGHRELLLLDRRERLIVGVGQSAWPVLARITGWRWDPPAESDGVTRLRETSGTGRTQSFIAGRAAIPLAGWTVVIRRPVESIVRSALANQGLSLAALLGTLALAAGLAAWTARRVTRPLTELQGFMRAFRLGERQVRDLAPSGDAPAEVAEVFLGISVLAQRLDRSYDSLAASLHEQERLGNELQELADGLERQVDERTAQLATSEKRYRALVDESLGLMCHHDLEGKILFVNRAAEQALGYRSAELAGRGLNEVLPPAATEELAGYLAALQAGGEVSGLMKVVTRSGALRVWQYRNHVAVEQGRPAYVVGHAVDVTERYRAEKAAQHLALHDALTGLANRVLFESRLLLALDEADRRQEQAAVLYLDLDGFKEVNDRYGHAAGDWVLREAAVRLMKSVRKVDTVARLGGDELAVVLAHLGDSAQADEIARKVVTAVANGFSYEGASLAVTASVGVAVYPRDGRTAEEILAQADAAMYAAKRRGKNRWETAGSAEREGPDVGARSSRSRRRSRRPASCPPPSS
jgi:diguanylate cyclase (GGDEF)-like protein/PAS domain S-box-containing protein